MENIEYVHEDGEVMTREKELDIKKYYLKMAFAKKLSSRPELRERPTKW